MNVSGGVNVSSGALVVALVESGMPLVRVSRVVLTVWVTDVSLPSSCVVVLGGVLAGALDSALGVLLCDALAVALNCASVGMPNGAAPGNPRASARPIAGLHAPSD